MALPAASHSRDLTDEQWVLIGPFLPKLARRTDGRGRPWWENRAVLNGILWSSGPAPHGPTSRTGIPPIKRATGGFSSGCARVCCGAFSRSSPRLSTTKAIWICRKPSSMGASHQRSREAPVWARRSAGRARRSWRSPIAANSPSRFTLRVPRRTKSPWSTQPSRSGLSSRSLCVSSGTTPTSRTAWMPTWPAVVWN
jgi:transposase